MLLTQCWVITNKVNLLIINWIVNRATSLHDTSLKPQYVFQYYLIIWTDFYPLNDVLSLGTNEESRPTHSILVRDDGDGNVIAPIAVE